MEIFEDRQALATYLEKNVPEGASIGFVPTMGALHEGHLALVRKARAKSSLVVVSLFINRRQFNNPDDFEKYPRNVQADLSLLETVGPDVVFLPEEENLFRGVAFPVFDLGSLDDRLEGKFRPGHFRGVFEVLWVFFSLIRPRYVFMGQKDLQQCALVEKLLKQHFPFTTLRMVPTVRDKDGLALSSRNLRLTPEERKKAAGVSRALLSAANALPGMAWTQLRQDLLETIHQTGFSPEYVELIQYPDFSMEQRYKPGSLQAICLAYNTESVRLIDNAWVKSPLSAGLFS